MKEVKPSDKGGNPESRVQLPSQKSATDTSNWENRNVSASIIDRKTKKRVTRNFDFIRNTGDSKTLTFAQLKKLQAQNHAQKTSD